MFAKLQNPSGVFVVVPATTIYGKHGAVLLCARLVRAPFILHRKDLTRTDMPAECVSAADSPICLLAVLSLFAVLFSMERHLPSNGRMDP
jgi:hypothetical protein